MDSLMTVKEAARYLRLKAVTVYRLAQTGRIPAAKVGRSWRFKKELLDDWLRRRSDRVPGRILVVDDDPAIRDSLAALLRAKGYHVRTAASGEEAVTLYAQEPPDLVLLDVILPAPGGPETFRRLRGLDPAARVILITGYHEHRHVTEAMELGPVMLMPKPFGAREVESILDIVFKE